MKMNIHKIFLGNIALTAIGTLSSIILVPFYIRIWGDALYANWLVVFGMLSFISLLDMGLIHYIGNHLHILNTQSKKYAWKISSLTLSLFIGLLLAFNIVFAAALFIIKIVHPSIDYFLILFVSLNVSLSIISSYLTSLFRSYNKNHYGIYITLVYNVVLYAGVLILLQYFSSPPKIIALWMASVVMAMTIWTYYILKKDFHFKFKFLFSIWKYRVYLHKSVYFLVFKLGTNLKVYLPTLILSLGAPFYLIMFTLHRTIINIPNQLLILLHTTLWQDLTRNHALNKNELIKHIYILNYLFLGVFSITLSFFVYIWYENIFHVWLGKGYAKYCDHGILLYFLIFGVLNTLWNSGTIFLISKNDHIELSKRILIYSVFSNIIGLPFYLLFKLHGFLAVYIAFEVLVGFGGMQKHILERSGLLIRPFIKTVFMLILYTALLLIGIFLIKTKILVCIFLTLTFVVVNGVLLRYFYTHKVQQLFIIN